MYASGQGRWLSPDPLRACPLHPQKFDRYAYVGNSPTNRTDPRGDAVYPGFDYPYIDYGYGYYPPGYGYDEFDYLINFGVIPDYPPYGYPPYYGGLGFIAPFPTASKIACAFCVAACQGAYAGALSVCFRSGLPPVWLSSVLRWPRLYRAFSNGFKDRVCILCCCLPGSICGSAECVFRWGFDQCNAQLTCSSGRSIQPVQGGCCPGILWMPERLLRRKRSL